MSRNDAPTRLEYRASKGERGAGVSHSPRACPCGQLSERTNTGSGRGRAAQQKTFRAGSRRVAVYLPAGLQGKQQNTFGASRGSAAGGGRVPGYRRRVRGCLLPSHNRGRRARRK